MLTYAEFKSIRDIQESRVNVLSDKLRQYPTGASGMTVEHIRMSDEYRAVKSQYRAAFDRLREINNIGQKLFKKEVYSERMAEREQKRIKA